VRGVGGVAGLTVKARLENVYARSNFLRATSNAALSLGGLVGEFTNNELGGGIYYSYFYAELPSVFSFTCTLANLTCSIDPVAGSSADYALTAFPSVAYPNNIVFPGLSSQNPGDAQAPASFLSITPNWVDGGGADLMFNYLDAEWEFFNGSLPRLDDEIR
jgi:hypothetical protein